MIEVLLIPTARCDRGCSHCAFASAPDGESISPAVLSSLPRELARLGPGEKNLCITGGGEPLLYPWTPKLIWEVMRDQRNLVDLVTSGCKDESDSGFKTLEVITEAFRSNRFQAYLSYNAYNPTADERFVFTLPRLRRINGLVCVKVALSYADRTPMERIDSMLQEMGYEKLVTMVDRYVSPRTMERLSSLEVLGELADFSQQVYIRENDYDESDLDEGFCAYKYHIVSVMPQNLSIEGRAENIAPSFKELKKHTTLRRRCRFLCRDGFDKRLFIDHTGSIYPCAMEMPKPNEELRIGYLGELPLWEAMAKRGEKISQARRNTLLSQSALYSNPCGYCGDNSRTGA